MDEPKVLEYLSPKMAAQHLGVSASALRRYTDIYEEVHEPIVKNPDTGGYLWTLEAVERLGEARNLFKTGRAASIKQGLELLASDIDLEMTLSPATPGTAPATTLALETLLEEVKALREEVAEMRTENKQLQARLALDAPRLWWQFWK